jgi:hypothetical protein
MPDDPWFIIRAWPVDVSGGPVDEPASEPGPAIDRARELAHDRRYRSVIVTDQSATVWAQFNTLWGLVK